MNNLWNEQQAAQYQQSDLAMQVYSSHLLGRDAALAIHGSGNTSVKSEQQDIFGHNQAILSMMGSGCDLKTIEPQGFAPVKLDHLLKLATLEHLSDVDLVKELQGAMTDLDAPSPSVGTLLHALIPYQFVDHTHADIVATISNTTNGAAHFNAIYGERVLVLPYAMPGFAVSKLLYQAIQGIDWAQYDGIVLLNHGIFTFADDAKSAYDMMIRLVSQAEDYLKQHNAWAIESSAKPTSPFNPKKIASLRQQLSQAKGNAMIVKWHNDDASIAFSQLENVADIASKGPLCPDHVIQTKRIAMLLGDDISQSIEQYHYDYQAYFNQHGHDNLQMLDPVPRVAIAPNQGFFAIADNIKRANIVGDIYQHTIKAIQQAEKMGGWQALSGKEVFELEYWSLQQTKLKRDNNTGAEFTGKVAFVTGGASGIGKATVRELLDKGACVISGDISANISDVFNDLGYLGVVCDVASSESIEAAISQGVQAFGGIDIVVTNAGTFPPSALVEDLAEQAWTSTLDINLSGHYRVIKYATPYLKLGIDPSIVIIGSKNVLAPGPGVAAYSCAKAGLTQLGRVSALELAPFGIRVNTVHPNAVFDTDIWSEEVINTRAANYGLSVDEYKRTNLLSTEITSANVARLVSLLASNDFAKTTGAQIPIDGGNERVI